MRGRKHVCLDLAAERDAAMRAEEWRWVVLKMVATVGVVIGFIVGAAL